MQGHRGAFPQLPRGSGLRTPHSDGGEQGSTALSTGWPGLTTKTQSTQLVFNFR